MVVMVGAAIVGMGNAAEIEPTSGAAAVMPTPWEGAKVSTIGADTIGADIIGAGAKVSTIGAAITGAGAKVSMIGAAITGAGAKVSMIGAGADTTTGAGAAICFTTSCTMILGTCLTTS